MIDEEDEGELETNFLIRFTMEVPLIRLLETTFISSLITINAQVVPAEAEEAMSVYEVSYAKVRWWLENVLGRAIAFDRGNTAGMRMLLDDEGRPACGNYLMMCPEAPTDENIAALLQAKLSALADHRLMFVDIEISSASTKGLSFTFIGDAEMYLPDMTEWIGERTYFDTPWWCRADASTHDVVPADDADLSVKPKWAYSLDFIEQAFRPNEEVVIRAEFKPTVIDGGAEE